VLERELATEKAAEQGAERRLSRLILRAPNTGIVTDIGPGMHAGRWLGGDEAVAYVVSPDRYDIQAYIDENDVWRVERAAMARFVPDDLAQPSRPAKLVETASAALELIDQPMLASTNGGPIAVNEDAAKKLKPRDALYRFRFVAPVDRRRRATVIQPIPGKLIIDAQATSLIGGLLRSVARIWRSEASLS
jgi:putative peptide zinc metalloprotease protein